MILAAEVARIAPKPVPLAKRILALLEKQETITSPEAAAALGCPVPSASKALGELHARGLIKRVRECVRNGRTLPSVFALNRADGGGR